MGMRIRTAFAISAALLSAAAGLILLLPRHIERPLPLAGAEILADVDAADAIPGNSELFDLESADGRLGWSTLLRTAREWPYAGVRLVFGDSSGNGCLDWSPYDTLRLKLSSTLATGLTLGADTRVPPHSDRNPDEKLRRIQLDIPSSPDIREYRVALQDFQVPFWWKSAWKLNLLDNRGFLDAVCALNLTNTSVNQKVDLADTTAVYGAVLSGTSRPNPLGAGFVLLSLLALLLPIFRPQQFGLAPPSSPSKIELQDHERELAKRIAAWYDEHYMESDLPMEKAARQIGIHPKKLQTVLRETFRTTHKARLSTLRLDEAARLLRETNNPVGEIALSVGFNAASHFNRCFKERFGTAPQAYRARSAAETPAEGAEKGPEGPN